MKRLAVGLVLMASFLLAGCGGGEKKPASGAKEPPKAGAEKAPEKK